MTALHPSLMDGRWNTLTLAEQMGNVGSEVHRVLMWKERNDPARYASALERALELLDATAADPRWGVERKKEILRVREGMLGFLEGENAQAWNPEALQRYFDGYAVVARRG